MWEDNDALTVTDVFQMTEVSLNASVVLYINVNITCPLSKHETFQSYKV